MKIEKGLKFKSKWFEGTVEVLEVLEKTNILKVKIIRSESSWWFEDWNLEHTYVGFERSDYTLLEVKPKFKFVLLSVERNGFPELFSVHEKVAEKFELKDGNSVTPELQMELLLENSLRMIAEIQLIKNQN